MRTDLCLIAFSTKLENQSRHVRIQCGWNDRFLDRERITEPQPLDIDVTTDGNVGRTGHLVPFAMLKPTHLSGVTVSTATLHNEEDLARKDVRVGDEVVITRAGDVIPQVIAPLIQRRKGKRLRKAKPPAKCPICGTPTVKPEGVWTICPNRKGCPGQVFQHVKHFVHRGAMDIDGFGEKQAQRFLEDGLITDAAGIYDLTADQLTGMERFGRYPPRTC